MVVALEQTRTEFPCGFAAGMTLDPYFSLGQYGQFKYFPLPHVYAGQGSDASAARGSLVRAVVVQDFLLERLEVHVVHADELLDIPVHAAVDPRSRPRLGEGDRVLHCHVDL